MRRLTHLSLFSGIGGLDLAAEMAGFKTVGQCEWADYQTAVLEKHWPDVPRWRDIRTLTGDSFYERTGLRTVDVISGGFPCQPFSVAGKRKGQGDDRFLWPEMLRVIRELMPAWIIGENVPGIVDLALDQVLADLEGEGYRTQAFIVPACAVDAPHRRDRVAIIAHRDSDGRGRAGRSSEERRDDDAEYHDLSAYQEEIPGRGIDAGIGGMDDGLRAEVYRAAADTDYERRESGLVPENFAGGGTAPFQLRELLELTPLGRIGLTKPEYLEWMMGYPIGWTELSASETR